MWTSKAHADCLETEQLMPTVGRLMGPTSADSVAAFYSYEATDLAFGVEQVAS